MLFTSGWAREYHCLSMEMEFKVLHSIMFGVAFHLGLNLEIKKKNVAPILFLFVEWEEC